MFQRFIAWLNPPDFEDQNKAQRARMLRHILNTLTLALLFGVLSNWFGGRRQPGVYLLWFSGLGMALVMRRVLSQGRTKLVSYAVVLFGYLMVTGFAINWGTIRSPNTIFFILVVMLAGLLISRQAMIVAVAAASMIVLGIELAENVGLLPQADSSTAVPMWLSYMVIFIVTAFLLNFVLRNNEEAFGLVRREVAERKQVDVYLRESEAKFRSIFEHSSDGIMLTDQNGCIIEWNHALETLTGYTRQEVLGKPVWDAQFLMMPEELKPDNPLEKYRSRIIEALASGEGDWLNMPNEGRLRRADGETTYYQQIAFLVPVGNNFRLASATRDITAQKMTETALKLNETRLNALLELSEKSDQMNEEQVIAYGLEQAVQITASKIGYLHFVNENQETIELNSWSRETLKECQAVFDNHYPLSEAGVWADCARQKSPAVHNNYQALNSKGGLPEGHSELVRHMSVPVIDQDLVRAIVGVGNKGEDYDEADVRQLLLLADTTWKIVRRKRVENEIRQLNESLEQRVSDRTEQLELAYRELEMLSYNVSHTLRAPLRAIDGYNRLALEQCKQDEGSEVHDLLHKARQSAQLMGAIIDDLLTLLSVARAQPNPTSVDISAMVSDMLDEMQANDPARNVETVIAPQVIAQADPKLLEMALKNLLDNAWKFTQFTHQARIEFGALSKGDEAIYYVRDNGAGFDMAYAHKIYDAFERLHLVDQFEGSGIGLTIVQRIIKLHNGRIWAEAQPDRGATFYFTLAAKEPI